MNPVSGLLVPSFDLDNYSQGVTHRQANNPNTSLLPAKQALWGALNSMEYNPHALRVQLRQRHHHIVSGHDVRLVGLVEVKVGSPGAEERGDDEVEFAVGETVFFFFFRGLVG